MIDFAALMEYAFENRLYESEIHGIEHWHQVEFNGLLLAPKTGADIDVVRLFALFHDCRRLDDRHDAGHGPRAAEFAKLCREEKRFEIDDGRFDLLYRACDLHTSTPRTGNPTIDTCFDADRLDLGRVGFKLDPNRMATEWGAKIARKSLTSGVSVFHMREWIRSIQL
ncbi:MAG: hypothetical protein MJY82_04860 [Fibrobacter sp.]|nr:hypothetical protein [Fibrobacter sp.]